MPIVHGVNGSPFVRKVHVAMAEKGLIGKVGFRFSIIVSEAARRGFQEGVEDPIMLDESAPDGPHSVFHEWSGSEGREAFKARVEGFALDLLRRAEVVGKPLIDQESFEKKLEDQWKGLSLEDRQRALKALDEPPEDDSPIDMNEPSSSNS